MMTGTTSSGFDFEIDESRLDSWELIEDLAALSDGQELKIVPVAKNLLGEEQLNRLKEHVKEQNGSVSLSAMFKEINEIMETDSAKKR